MHAFPGLQRGAQSVQIPPPESTFEYTPSGLAPPPHRKAIKPVSSCDSLRDQVPFPSSRTVSGSMGGVPRRHGVQEETNPLRSLCQHMNVRPIILTATERVPDTVDIPYSQRALLPTHFLCLYNSKTASSPHILVPVRQDLLSSRFRAEMISSTSSLSHALSVMPFYRGKVPHITVPVVTIQVPNPETIPLLFLFALGLRPMDEMATSLLPPEVIEEFPSSAAMSEVLSRLPDDKVQRYITQNQALWMNILALGPKDEELTGMVKTAWNVVAEGERIRRCREKRPRRPSV